MPQRPARLQNLCDSSAAQHDWAAGSYWTSRRDQARETASSRSIARHGVARAMSGAHSVVRARTIALRRCEKSLNTSSGVRIVPTVAACCVLCSTQRHSCSALASAADFGTPRLTSNLAEFPNYPTYVRLTRVNLARKVTVGSGSLRRSAALK